MLGHSTKMPKSNARKPTVFSIALAAGTLRQNRTGRQALSSHRTVWFVFASRTLDSCLKLALVVSEAFYSPNETPNPRNYYQDGRFSTSLMCMNSWTVDRGRTLAPKSATKLVVIFRLFRVFLSLFNEKQFAKVIFRSSRTACVKIRKIAVGSNDLSMLSLKSCNIL